VNSLSLLIRFRTRRTRHELLKLREQLELAKKALTLLEEKYKILLEEAHNVRNTILPFQQELADKIEDAYALLSGSVISLGLRNVYKACVSTLPNDDVEMKWTSVRGVAVPRLFSKIQKRTPLKRGYGLTDTNYALDKTADAFEDTVIYLVQVAELANILRILEKEINKTRVRVSALQKVLIPSLEHETRVIENRLEESEMERRVMIRWARERAPEVL
jgi:V/A-type H+-transporting ATPase subunit D